MKKILFIAAAMAVAVACGTKKQAAPASSAPMVGGQRDAHGCLTSAGYTWSEVRNDCIRTWETGVKMLPASKHAEGAVMATYVVFSPDSTRAEVFLPGKDAKVLKRLDNKRSWVGEAADGLMLTAKLPGLELYDGSAAATWREERK